MAKKDSSDVRSRAAALFADKAVSAEDMAGTYVGQIIGKSGRLREVNFTGTPETIVSASFTLALVGKADGSEVSPSVLRDLSPTYVDVELRRTSDIRAFIETLIDFGVFDEGIASQLIDAFNAANYGQMAELVQVLVNQIETGAKAEVTIELRRKIKDPKYPYNYTGFAAA
jgi:hypothetical protein